MAKLKFKEIVKMELKEINSKIKELKMDMIKARVANQKSEKTNLRELKRTIARLMTSKRLKENNLKKEAKK